MDTKEIRVYGDYGDYYRSDDILEFAESLLPLTKIPFANFWPHKEAIFDRLSRGHEVAGIARDLAVPELSLRAFLIHLRLKL